MKSLAGFLIPLCLVAIATARQNKRGGRCAQPIPSKPLVCYYEGRVPIDRSAYPCLCTHIVHTTAATISDNSTLQLDSGVSEWSARLRERNPSLQVLLSVGGVGSEGVVKSLEKRSRFVASVGQVVRQAGLQGLELNLDLAPNAGPHGKERLVDLLKALRSELGGNANSRPKRDHRMTDIQDDKETTQQPIRANLTSTSRQSRRTDGTTSRKNRLEDELTTNSDGFLLLRVPTEPEILVKRYDLKNISKYVDFLTVPTHNLSDATERGLTYHPSRLMGLADILNTDSMLDLLTGLGAPHNMIIISIPASGTSFTLKDPEQNTPRSPASSGPKRISQGKLCSLLSEGGWTMERDEDLTAPYAFRNNTWLAFEDNISAGIKGKYVLLRDLAGAAVFPVDDDDLEDSCAPFTSNKTTEEGGGVRGKTRHLPWLVASLHDTFTHLARQSRQVVLENLQEQIKQSTLLTFSGDIQLSPYRITRIVDTLGAVHVVRKEARTQFECSRQGYFVHPLGCNRFYRCVKFNQYSADFTVFEYDCPAGLAFDERWEVCVWPGSLPRGSPCTGSSEIAPVPRARYACPAVEGYYADPENCRWFFACLDHARDGATALTAYEFRCPFGLVFDERKLVCDWPWLVGGCGSGYGGGAYFGAVQLDRGAYYGASNAAGVGVGLAGSRGYNAADSAHLQGAGRGGNLAIVGAGRGDSLATLNGPGYVATGANIATIGVQPISGSGLGSGRVYTSGAGVGIGAASGAGRGRVQYGSGEGSSGIFSSGGFGNAGVAAGESFGNVGGASSSYDQDRNIPSFAALPDSYVSGGRIDNTGGVVLETNLVGVPEYDSRFGSVGFGRGAGTIGVNRGGVGSAFSFSNIAGGDAAGRYNANAAAVNSASVRNNYAVNSANAAAAAAANEAASRNAYATNAANAANAAAAKNAAANEAASRNAYATNSANAAAANAAATNEAASRNAYAANVANAANVAAARNAAANEADSRNAYAINTANAANAAAANAAANEAASRNAYAVNAANAANVAAVRNAAANDAATRNAYAVNAANEAASRNAYSENAANAAAASNTAGITPGSFSFGSNSGIQSGYAGGNQGGNGLAFVPAESPRSAVVKTFNSPATSFRRPQVNIVQPQAQLVPAVAIDTSNTQFVQSTPTPFYSISSTPRPFYSISSTPRPFYSLSSTPQPQGSDVFLDTPRSPLVEKVSFYQSTPKTSYRRPQAQFVQTVVETPSVPVIQQGPEISFVSTTPRPVQRRPVIQQNQFVQPIPVAVNTPVVTYQSTPRPVYGPPLVAKTQLLEGVFGARGVPLVHQSPVTTFVQTGPQINFRETKKEFVQPLVQVTSSPVVQPIIADTARVSYKRPVVPQLQYEPNIVRTPLVQEAVSDGQPQVFDNAEVSFIQSTPRPSYRRPIVTQTQTPLFQQAVVGAPQQSSFQTSYRNKIVKAFPSVQTIVQAPQIPVVQNVPVATYNAQDISRTVTSVPVTTYRRPVTRLRPTVQSLPLTPTANFFQRTDKTETFDYTYDEPAVIRARPQGFGYNSGVGYVSSTARPTDFVTVSTPKTPAFISGGSQGYTSSSGAVFSTPVSLQEAEVPFVGYEGDFGAKTSFFRDGLAPSYQQDNLSSNQSSYRFGQGLNVRQRLRTPIEGGERGVVFTQGEGYQFNQRLVPLAPAISAPQSVAYSTRGSYSGGRRRPADISNGQVYPTTFRPTVVSTYSTTAPEVFLPSLSTPIFRSSTVAPISFVSSTPKTVTYPQDYVISAPKSVSSFSPSVTNSYSQTRPSRVRVASQSTTTDTYVNSSPGYSSRQGQVRKGNANKDRISGDRTGTLDENVDVLLNKYSGNFGGILNNNNNNEGFISDVIEGDLARKDGGRAGSRGRLELSTLAPNIDSTTSIGRGRVGGFTSKTQGSRLSAANRGNGGYGDNLSSDISTDDDKTELGTATIYDADGGVQFEAVKIGYGKTKGSREPIVVVTRLSDVNPILVAKLGAQCTCTKSNLVQLKRPESDRGPTYRGYSSSPDYGIIDGVSSTTSFPILTSSYSPREYVSPTTLSGRPYNVPRGNGFRSNVSPGVTLVTQAPTLSSVLLSEYPSSSTPRIVGIKSREQLVSPVVSIAPQPSSIFLTGAPTVVSLSPQPSVLVDTTSRRVPISSDRSSGYPRRRPDVDGSSNYRPGAGYGSGPRDELSGSPSSDDSVRTGGGPILGGASGPGLRGSSKSGLRGGSGSGLGDASRSGAAAGASFDRYGPGGLRGVDETLQGSVDCQRPGLFRHPKYCNKFYACHWDEWKNRYTLHVFNCPVQLAYDSSLGACNWPSQGPACSDDNLLV